MDHATAHAHEIEGDIVDHIDLDVAVAEHPKGGWIVVANAGGERKQFGGVHASKSEAEFYAKHMFSGADRWTGGGRIVPPDPEKYPGDHN